MAAPKSTTRSASQSYRRQALIWLMVTLLLGVVTALVWMFSQTPAMGAKIENAPISAPEELSDELEQPLKIESLNELDTDVQPLSFEATIRDLRNYPAEFKDKRYLLANKGKWTVQVMNVAENDVIVSYLEGRDDREKFSYFRYLDDEDQARYMLTYGLMSSPQEAIGAAKLIDFKLPADVRVLPEEINRYIGIIDNYERSEPLKDLSTQRSRSVNLQPTESEVPVRQQAEPEETQDADSSEESIRQSADTSDTLSVTEERVVDEEEESSVDTAEGEDGENEGQSQPAASGANNNTNSNNTNNSPPVVPTPRPPSSSNSANNASNTSTQGANAGGGTSNNPNASNNQDSIKQLIEERSN